MQSHEEKSKKKKGFSVTRPQPENFNPICGKCFQYVEVIVGQKSHKAERDKLNNKIKAKCLKYQNSNFQNLEYFFIFSLL